jgi:hypothetical protein
MKESPVTMRPWWVLPSLIQIKFCGPMAVHGTLSSTFRMQVVQVPPSFPCLMEEMGLATTPMKDGPWWC